MDYKDVTIEDWHRIDEQTEKISAACKEIVKQVRRYSDRDEAVILRIDVNAKGEQRFGFFQRTTMMAFQEHDDNKTVLATGMHVIKCTAEEEEA